MNLPVTFDASDIAVVVERARALLDDGDVAAARLLAEGAYAQAKAAAQFGARFDASSRLVDKARRLQGDALLIEARAKIRLANEWDAAQAAGVAAGKGRPKNVPDVEQFSADDAGLSRKDIHDARRLARAEQRDPGILERVIAARLSVGLEPSKANLRAAIGTRSATNDERGDNLYETSAEGIGTLLALERFGPKVFEPACGRGAIVRPLESAGYRVALADKVDYDTADRRGRRQRVEDFLASKARRDRPDIVTNPPYGTVLNAFVAHALRVHRPPKMALLLNLNFLAGFDDPDRCFALDECSPARVLVFSRRLPMMHRDGWAGNEASSQMNTAWFIWERQPDGGYAAGTIMRRVDWKDYLDAPPLSPGGAS